MSKQRELNAYITQVHERLRLAAWVRGIAILLCTALVVTIALILVLNRFAFPATGVISARAALILALAGAGAAGIALPLVRLTRERAVRTVERTSPALEQRLTTFHDAERRGADPFLELLAADTLVAAEDAPPRGVVPDQVLFSICGAGVACLAVLVWMIAAGPGYVGYGAALLWTGHAKDAQPYYSLSVLPGNVAVRRHSDQLITAQVRGLHPDRVELFARYGTGARWEPVSMQPLRDGGADPAYQFTLAGLPESVEYYVAAGPLVSSRYTVRVVDLPSIKGIRVTYHYPSWTGMKSVTDDHSGDLRAIEGTDANLEIETDKPLKNGQLALDTGQNIQLTPGQGNRYTGTIHMTKDGAYHLAAIDDGQPVRLSEDYFVATDKAQPPQIAIERPRGDYRANPIEEVTVGVSAADPFGLKGVHLHYSVNGGPDRDVSLLAAPGAKQTEGSHVLPLEDFKLVPGDVISVYATARDGHAEARTDISFIQVDPFEREFSQSQQAGGGGSGGGGAGNDQTEISKREKELIAATWKQQNDKQATAKDAAAAGQFLSDAQQKLRGQVRALSARMESRDLSAATEEFSGFDKDMQEAAAAMEPSADKLKETKWKDALPLEQKALQALLRAEATFRKIQVAFGQSGGGAGGSGSAGRDLASLFDLELDTEKNQYETAQSASPEQQQQKEIEDALAKLDALAKRQEEQASRQNPQQSFEQRWEQEMLRREAEQLRRQMEEMARNQQQGGQQGSSSSAGQSSSSQGSTSSGGGSSTSSSSRQGGSSSSGQQASNGSDPRMQQALRRLEQATEAMKRSSGTQDQQSRREAAEQLRQAENLLAGTQQQMASGKLGSMTQEAGRLAQQERQQAERIGKLASPSQATNSTDLSAMMERRKELGRLAQDRQQLSDDLSRLEKNLRDQAREVAPTQPGVAKQLRDALSEMDDNELDNRVQRTSDWLRRGIDPNSNGTEGEIAQGLKKLQDRLQQAQEAMSREPGRGVGNGRQGDQTAALDTIERLRSQIEQMARAGQSRAGQGSVGENAQNNLAQNGSRQGQDGARSGNADSQFGVDRLQRGGGQAGGQRGNGQQAGAQSAPGGVGGGHDGERMARGDVARGDVGGDVRRGGGQYAGGTVWGNINTGNNRYPGPGQRPAPSDAGGNPGDAERSFEQGMREVNQLRGMIKDDPQVARQAEELARQMAHLDPRRFPGNPDLVDAMHREVLSSIDRLELQVERKGDAAGMRTGRPNTVPQGYQDAVADYYRQLSKAQ